MQTRSIHQTKDRRRKEITVRIEYDDKWQVKDSWVTTIEKRRQQINRNSKWKYTDTSVNNMLASWGPTKWWKEKFYNERAVYMMMTNDKWKRKIDSESFTVVKVMMIMLMSSSTLKINCNGEHNFGMASLLYYILKKSICLAIDRFITISSIMSQICLVYEIIVYMEWIKNTHIMEEEKNKNQQRGNASHKDSAYNR